MDPESNVDSNKNIEIPPMAFTIEFNDQKVDDSRKLRIHERLSAFALKHRRNPSLPDFGAVKNAPKDKLPSPLSSHVPGKNSKISPTGVQNGLSDLPKYLKNRRSSLNDVEAKKIACQNVMPMKVEFKVVKNGAALEINESENKSDTVSEAGTYTVDKEEGEDDSPVKDAEITRVISKEESEEEEDEEFEVEKENFHHKWINDWVSKVAEQNLLNPVPKEPPPIVTRNSGSGSSSPGASKIPSPINTLNRHKKTLKPSDEKSLVSKLNGSLHRRSSSLSAKDYHENRTSDSSLETESYLRTTESVVTAMQNRMRLSLDGRNSDLRKSDKRDYGVKEKPHPPSTASDTDTNSENEGKVFKKPLGNPFTSARLNRAFSLRRAKAEPETDRSSDSSKKKPMVKETDKKNVTVARSTPSPNPVKSKPPITSPFSRTDCGRFSMRSTVNTPKLNPAIVNTNKKVEVKKTAPNPRSNSSLSSKEVEFQNWKRRKSFDPMKAAAEGRKKELARKAAMSNQTMTQSVNLGTTIRTRSGNPVLRSASFHSTPQQVLGSDEVESEEYQDQTSADDQEETLQTSWISNQPPSSLTYNSPIRTLGKCTLITRAPVCSSRCSLSSIVSETHSSPSHRARAEVLDNLVMTAINDLSYKLKSKSCNLLKKLHYLYDADEDRSDRLRDVISDLENRKNSNTSSPIHQTASKDLSNILKNLKCMENVLKVLDDVLFDENLEVYIEN